MQKRTGKIIKRALLALLAVILILLIVYWDLILYGLRQGRGQLNIVWNARPVEEVMKDPTFPDSLKTKLILIERVRKYAIDSLGLEDTENYKTLYDQRGEEIMWVVTACEPFRFNAKEWDFPVVGSVPYKGYFNKDRAIKLRDELDKEGWDTSIRNPGGWSTLGWFTDPILSKMLERSEGDLANLIIHEMVHATIFVKDSIDFNENLATFIGDRGAEAFLIAGHGKESNEYKTYVGEDSDFTKYSEHMLRGTEMLDSLYKTMQDSDPVEQKAARKKAAIQEIIRSLDTLSLTLNKNPSQRFAERLPNNTYFINMKRYQSQQEYFWQDMRTNFAGDLKTYIRYHKKKHPFL